MRNADRIVVVIPARNEAEALPRVLARVPQWVDAVVVADNGSSDATAAMARAGGARVVHEPEPGYGAACHRGSQHPDARGADVLVFLDADGSDDPREMDRLVDAVGPGRALFAIGVREPRGAMPAHQRMGTAIICRMLSLGFGHRVRDLGPFRALRRSAFDTLALRDRRYGWTAEMQARALRLGILPVECEVSWQPGQGRSEITGTWRGVARAAFGLGYRSAGQIVGFWWDRLRRIPRG